MHRLSMGGLTLLGALLLISAFPAAAQNIRTVVSSRSVTAPASPASGNVVTAAELPAGAMPHDLAVDARGNLYIAVDESSPQTSGRRIFVLTPEGTLTPFGGEAAGDGGLAADADGNVFLAHHGAIRRIDAATGVTTTLGPREPLSEPMNLALDGSGNLYIADSIAGAVFVLSVQTGELALLAHVASPGALAVGPSGASLYVVSPATAGVLRIDTRTHAISLVAGTGLRGSLRSAPANGGLATSAQLGKLSGIAIDAAGNLFIADATQNAIHRVDARAHTISTVAGMGHPGYSGDGGPAIEAELNEPGSLALDRAGNLFFVDQGNGAVRVVEHAGVPAQASSSVTLTCPGGGTACFTFAAQPVAGTEGPQTILLSNNSGVVLVINLISFGGGNAGDFAQANSCGQSVGIGATCNINVTFTPQATGARSSTLMVVDSDGSSPQTAVVSGTGDDYELGAPMGGSLTQTVTAGAPASYSLVVTPDNVFSGMVTLQCPFPAGLPPLTTCAINQSATQATVTVTAGTPAPFTLSLTTTKRATPPGPMREFPSLPWGIVAVFFVVAILWGAATRRRFSRREQAPALRRRARPLLPAFALFAVFAMLSGCYGHHRSYTTTGTAAGTYTVTIVGNAQNASRALTLTLVVQ